MDQSLLFKELNKLLADHEALLSGFEKLKQTAPEGSMSVRKKKGQLYFVRNFKLNGNWIEVPIPTTHSGKLLIASLIRKRVVIHGLGILRKNTRCLKQALSELKSYDPEQYLPKYYTLDMFNDGIRLPDNYYLPGQLNTIKWIAETRKHAYRTNPSHPENLLFETASGHKVRSKSELQIDELLYSNGLIYRYDSELVLADGTIMYPDFVVLHPKEKRLIIIEHFGRMDDPKYAAKQMKRLKAYAENGYILGRDLFFTMETKAEPLERWQIIVTLQKAGLIR